MKVGKAEMGESEPITRQNHARGGQARLWVRRVLCDRGCFDKKAWPKCRGFGKMVIRAAARPRRLTSPRIAATQIAQDVANTSKTMRGETFTPATNMPPTSRAPESIATIPKNHNRPIRTDSRAIAATSSLHSVLPRSVRRSSTAVTRPPTRRAFSDRECFDKKKWWRERYFRKE